MELDEEIQELETKLRELRAKRKVEEDERRRLELLEGRKIVAHISKFSPNSNRVTIKLSKFRDDIVDWFRYKTDRIYSEPDGNILSIQYLQPFLDKWSVDDTVTIEWDNKSLQLYEEWKNRPDLLVDIDDKRPYVTLELGPRMAGQYLYLNSIITSFTNDIGKGYRFSIAEFYLFPDAIKDQLYALKESRVEYTDRAKATLMEQLDRRKTITELANATDVPDMPSPFLPGYDLKPHQRVAVKFIEKSGGKGIIAYDMGTGKSAIEIALAERNVEWKKVLFICPASLKTNIKREIKKFTGKDAYIFSGIEPDGTDIDALQDPNKKYYIINYDIIGRQIGDKDDKVMPWVTLFNFFKFDYISIDECHYIKNMESKRSVGVRALEFKNVTPMSGTVIVNRPSELYPNLNIVAPETFNSPTAFANQFTNMDGTARNVRKLHDMISTYMIRRTRKDIYGDKIFIERIPFSKELSSQARANYQRILEGIYISLRRPDYQRNVTSIFAELIRCKQTCSADNISASADLAINAYDETEKKVLIFSQFKESQYGIHQLLGTDISCVVNGDVRDEERYKLMDRFQDPKSKLKYWVTNILEGLTLTEAHTVIFNDIWWTPKDHSQAEGRAFGRDNDPHGGNSYWLENENTIDQFLNDLLMKKTAVFNEVVDGVRDSQADTLSVMGALIEHLKGSM